MNRILAIARFTTVPLFVILTLLLTACQFANIGGPRVAGSPQTPPDYDMPESQFSNAQINKLSSEFLDEYAGQYVVFEGRYLTHAQGAQVASPKSGVELHPDLMFAMIGSPAGMTSPRSAVVYWMVDDRELGRPFLNLAQGAGVRIYGYVLPANKMAKVKSRNDRFMRGFPSPIILLVKAEPVAGK
jgi:hypothetical protein